MYRYRRLGEARAAAHEAGFRGAMFPWQSGSEGKEETQRVHLNPLSGRWEPDLSRNQRHVNAAIFYNIWHYFQATQDLAFLRDYGAEMMLEIARFWASIAHFNPDRGPLRDPRGDGPGRISREVPGRDRGRPSKQRLHQRDGGLAVRARARGPLAAARKPRGGAQGQARARRRRAAHVGGHEPADVRALPGRGHHQPVRRLGPAGGTRLGRLSRQVRKHPAARPDPARRGRRPRSLQALQAGRHRDVVLPVLATRSSSGYSIASATTTGPTR